MFKKIIQFFDTLIYGSRFEWLHHHVTATKIVRKNTHSDSFRSRQHALNQDISDYLSETNTANFTEDDLPTPTHWLVYIVNVSIISWHWNRLKRKLSDWKWRPVYEKWIKAEKAKGLREIKISPHESIYAYGFVRPSYKNILELLKNPDEHVDVDITDFDNEDRCKSELDRTVSL